MQEKNIKKLTTNNSDEKVVKKYFIDKILRDSARPLFNRLFARKASEEKIENNTSEKILKIDIHLRHVYYSDPITGSNGKNRPSGFSYEKIMQNLTESLSIKSKSVEVKLWIYYTGEFSQLICDPVINPILKSKINFEFIIIKAASSLESWLIMLRAVKQLKYNDEDILYFLENDYIHDLCWVNYISELFKSNIKFDYISLYDHPDRYVKKENYRKSELHITENKHWIETDSTCASFITTYKIFNEDFKEFYTYRNDDKIFRKLTKKLNRVLIMPIPSLSTHAESEHLSPVSKLEKLLNI